MLNLPRVAITGGLACGKTTVCKIFKELGACVVDADTIVHELLSHNTSINQQIISLLGADILTDGQIDRGKVAKKVFTDQQMLRSLETIIHPAVMLEIEKRYQQSKKQGKASLFVAEIPLLFEIGGEQFFDYAITVTADRQRAVEWFAQRPGQAYSAQGAAKEAYEQRMKQQMPLPEKMKRAHFLIDNSGDLSQLRQNVMHIYQKITRAQ